MNNILLGSAEPHAELLRSVYPFAAGASLSAQVAGMRSCPTPDVPRRQGTALSAVAERPTT